MSGGWKWWNIKANILSDRIFLRCQQETLDTFAMKWLWLCPADPRVCPLLWECVLGDFGAGCGSSPSVCPTRPLVRGTTTCFTSCWQGCPCSTRRRCSCRRLSPTFTWTRWVSWGCWKQLAERNDPGIPLCIPLFSYRGTKSLCSPAKPSQD